MFYHSSKCPKKINFNSRLKYGYAKYLDSLHEVQLWNYGVMWTYYLDGFSGRQKKYICSFRIEYQNDLQYDGHIEYIQKKVIHVEVQPLSRQTFEDKYLYAQNIIPNWRFITEDEIMAAMECSKDFKLTKRPKKSSSGSSLDLEKILDLIKKGLSVKEIGKRFGRDYRTVVKFLEDRSYVVDWRKSRRIWHATRKIWPE